MAEKKPRMTMTQFMKELTKQKGKFGFTEEGCIRKDIEKSFETCPITAVCCAKFDQFFSLSSCKPAAKVMGLSQRETKQIIGAADKLLGKCGCNQKEIRLKMLRILGLKEKTS